MYGEYVLTKRQCQNWSDNFNLEDTSGPGRPLEADVDKIKSLVDANRQITTPDFAESVKRESSQAHATSRINFQTYGTYGFLMFEICFVALTTAIPSIFKSNFIE